MKLNCYNLKIVASIIFCLIFWALPLKSQEIPPEPHEVPEVPAIPESHTIIITLSDLSLESQQLADQYLEAIEQLENTLDDYVNYFERFDSNRLRDNNITFEKFAQGIETDIYSRAPKQLAQDLDECIDRLHKSETSLRTLNSRSDKKLYRLVKSLRRELAVILDLIQEALSEQEQNEDFTEELRIYISHQIKQNKVRISVVEQEAFARQYEKAIEEYVRSFELFSEDFQIEELATLKGLKILEGIELSDDREWMLDLSIEQQREILKVLKSIDIEFTPGNEPVIVQTRRMPRAPRVPEISRIDKSGYRSFSGLLGVSSEQKPIYITHPLGDVRITGCDESTVSADLIIMVEAPSEEDRENFLEGIKLKMGQDKDGYFVETIFPRLTSSYTKVVKSVLTIMMPSENKAICDHSFGEIEIESLDFGALIKGNNSEITASNISGRLKIENSLGSVTVDRVEGMIQVTNTSGKIFITECSGRGKISNSAGLISISESEGDFKIVNSGPVNIVEHNGNLDIENYNGSVTLLNIQGDISAYSTLQPLLVEDITGEVYLENRNGEIKAYQITGSLEASTSYSVINASWITEQINLNIDHGSILLELGDNLEYDSKITASSSEVKLFIPAESDLLIKTVADECEISSDFPMDLSVKGKVQSGIIKLGRANTKLLLKAMRSAIIIEEL